MSEPNYKLGYHALRALRWGGFFCLALVFLLGKASGPDPLVSISQSVTAPPPVTITALN